MYGTPLCPKGGTHRDAFSWYDPEDELYGEYERDSHRRSGFRVGSRAELRDDDDWDADDDWDDEDDSITEYKMREQGDSEKHDQRANSKLRATAADGTVLNPGAAQESGAPKLPEPLDSRIQPEPPRAEVTGVQFYGLAQDRAAQLEITRQLVSMSLISGYKNIPDAARLCRAAEALILKDGLATIPISQIALRAAIELGMTAH